MKKRSIYEIEIFKNIYEDNNIEKTQDNQLMVYYIGSPYYKSSHIQSNDKILPVYIHWTNKKKNISKFIIYKLNWLDISFVKISSIINSDGTISNYELSKKLSKKYKDIIKLDVDIFELDNPLQNFEYISFSDVCSNLKLLRKINNYNTKILKNEQLLTFKLPNNKSLVIPGIEVVKFFYVNSQFNSLKKYILDENAISRLVKDLPLPIVNDEIHLNLKKGAKLKDKHLIFYFAYIEKYQSLFNDVYTKFLNEKVIYSPIPTNKKIKIKVHFYERDNYIYVLKILQSTHYKEELSSIREDIIVTHPKKLNIEYKEKKKKKTPTEDADATDELDTNDRASISSTIDNVEIEDFNDFELDTNINNEFDFNLDMKEIKLDKVEKRTRTPKVNEQVPAKPISSRDKSKNKGSSIGTEVEKDKKSGKILDYDKLIKLLEKKSFNIKLYNGSFKNVAAKLEGKDFIKFEKRSNTYVDNKETYRSYILIRIEKNNQIMFFFDIQPREKYDEKTQLKQELNRNSILLVEDNKSLKKFHKKYIGKFIFDFSISSGNWVKVINNYFSEQRHFFLKHSSVDGLQKSIIDKFK